MPSQVFFSQVVKFLDYYFFFMPRQEPIMLKNAMWSEIYEAWSLLLAPPLSLIPLQPSGSDKMSELLPPDWSANKELYSLRYKAKDDDTSLLLKAILDNSILTFYLMVSKTGWRVHRVDTFCNF